MNRREYLRELMGLGVSLSISPKAFDTASDKEVDDAWNCLQATNKFDIEERPRIALLRNEVLALDFNDQGKEDLLASIEINRDNFIDGLAPIDGRTDLEYLMYFSPGMSSEVSMYQISKKQAQEYAIAEENEYQRVHGLIGEIKTSSGLSENNKPPSLPKDIFCSRNAIFGADFSLCVEYLRPLNQIPVCDFSVSSIIIRSSFPCTHPEYLEIFNHVVFTGMATLAKIAQEDPRIVWISCGTSFGLPLFYKECKISQVLTDGRIYGIVAGSALNQGYAGLTLYEWNSESWAKGQLGRIVAKFKRGEIQEALT